MSPNEDLVRGIYAAFSAGDLDALAQLMSPDVVHRIPGSNLISGEHRGRDAVFALYGAFFELTGGTLAVELQSMQAEGANRVVRHRVTGERDGRHLDSQETVTVRVADGQAVELAEAFADPAAVDAFWS